MSSRMPARPDLGFVATEPNGEDPAELYLSLMKRVTTRALTAKGVERHTVRPRGPKSRAVHRFNRTAARWGLEMVRLNPSSAEDYLESGHAAENRVEDAETMLGTRQLDHMQRCVREILKNHVEGDLLEAGVWRGGMTIFMRAVLKAYQVSSRKVWVADSFEGLPPVNRKHDTFDWKKGDMAVSLEEVKANFERYSLLDDQVVFLKGFFAETLPKAPIQKLAILRVDADLYESTRDVLQNLYPLLSPGGYAIFDDYQNLPDCRRAIDEFRHAHNIQDELLPIDKRAVYWLKSA